MADLTAINSVGESIALLLQRRRSLLDSEGRLGPVPAAEDIRHHSLATITAVAPPTSGISIACYHIGYSDSSPSRRATPDPAASHGISLELYYLVTSWSSNAAAELANISWAMLELNRFPVLDRSMLIDPNGWDRSETVQILPEPAEPEQIHRIWDGLKQRVRLTALFRVRVVRIGYGPVADALPVIASRFSFAHGDPVEEAVLA
jgi:hypothetical protein